MTISSKTLQNFVLPYAFGAAIIRVGIDLISKIVLDNPLLYYLSFLLCFVLEVITIVYLTKKFKSINNNLLSVQEGLKIGLITMLIIGIIYSIVSFCYDTYIDPDFQINTMLAMVKKYNPAQLEQTLAQVEYSKKNPNAIGILTTTIWFIIVGFVISLVTGNLFKSEQ